MITPSKYLKNLASVLMHHKNLSYSAMSAKTGIPVTNLRALVGGVSQALTPCQYETLFTALGLGVGSDGVLGFTSDVVHVLYAKHVQGKYSHTDFERYLPYLKPLLENATAVVPYTKKGQTPVFIKSDTLRIIVYVDHSGMTGNLLAGCLGLPVCQKERRSMKAIPGKYLAVLKGEIGLTDFDCFYNDSYPRWENLHTIANASGVKYSAIAGFIKRQSHIAVVKEKPQLSVIQGEGKVRTASQCETYKQVNEK